MAARKHKTPRAPKKAGNREQTSGGQNVQGEERHWEASGWLRYQHNNLFSKKQTMHLTQRQKWQEKTNTSNEVPQVESLVALDALVGNLTGVVHGEGQTDHSKANSRQKEKNHHHVKATVQRLHQIWENCGGQQIIFSAYYLTWKNQEKLPKSWMT